MADEIKVTAQYETKSRLDNLERLSEIAKKATEEFNYAKTVIKPIIEAEGAKKYEAICEQLKPYTEFIHKNEHMFRETDILFPVVNDGGYSSYTIRVSAIGGYIKIKFGNSEFYTEHRGIIENISVDRFCNKNGILTHWNEFNFIEKLELAIANRVKEYTKNVEANAKSIYETKTSMER